MAQSLKELVNNELLEQKFRLSNLKNDKIKALTFILLVIFSNFVVIFPEIMTDASNLNLNVVLICRVVLLLSSCLSLALLKKFKRPKSLDITVFTYTFLFIIIYQVLQFQKIEFRYPSLLWAMGGVVGIYFLVPVTWKKKIFLSLFWSTATLFIILYYREFVPVFNTIVSTIIAFALANIVGMYTAYKSEVLLRTSYKTYVEEVQLREELEIALDQIKILEGFLPICSYCKSIRNDDGYWNRLEEYISTHTSATLSHGVCPDCLQEHHPETYIKMKDKGEF